jgi:hypothetical protein
MIYFDLWRSLSVGVCSKNAKGSTHNANFCVLYDQNNTTAPNNMKMDKNVSTKFKT